MRKPPARPERRLAGRRAIRRGEALPRVFERIDTRFRACYAGFLVQVITPARYGVLDAIPSLRTCEGVAVGVLLLFALASELRLIRKALWSEPRAFDTDGITRFEARLSGLREHLPAHGVVGYIDDMGRTDHEYVASFFLTQYTLSPLIVVDTPDREWVVGCFQDEGPPGGSFFDHELTLVKDLSNGIKLFRRETR